MRRTLSQSPDRLNAAPEARVEATRDSARTPPARAGARGPIPTLRGWLLVFLFIAFVPTLMACSRGEGEDAASDGGGADATSAEGAGSGTGADFSWPTRPDPPLLRIEIEGAGVAGTIEIELMPELAPETIRQVRSLASQGFYDGTTFHRVIPDFMIQGGDPNSRDRDPDNDGRGGPGFTMPDELSAAPFERGVVGMGNKGRVDSNGSQFFIMHADVRDLDGRYTAIGRVRSGMEVVDAIARVETDRYGRWGPRDRPIEDVVMRRVRVTQGSNDVGGSSAPGRAASDAPNDDSPAE